MESTFQAWGDALGDDAPVHLVRDTFQDHARLTGATASDVVVVHNAINHLDEDACARLPAAIHTARGGATWRSFAAYLQAPQPLVVTFVLADAARCQRLENLVGLKKSPFAPTIE